MTAELPSRIVAEISFIGRGGGLVKTLGGFKPGHHTVPDAANAVTNAFLGKICGGELAAEAERLFQDARTRLGYKRKDVTLSVAAGMALLTARDFSVEILYALEEAAPQRYTVTTALRGLKSAELARTEAFDAIFLARFTEISFTLRRGAKVEEIVDVIEGLGGKGGLTVNYPSDCRECVIEVEGVGAQVRCTAAALELVFPRAGSPQELMEAFAAVRGAFSVNRELAALIA